MLKIVVIGGIDPVLRFLAIEVFCYFIVRMRKQNAPLYSIQVVKAVKTDIKHFHYL